VSALASDGLGNLVLLLGKLLKGFFVNVGKALKLVTDFLRRAKPLFREV
jgi:hypothetical protein